MAWSPNYCLNCDKQTYEQHYCSQSCRLADLEKSSYSTPATPGYDYSASSSRPASSSSPYSALSFSVTTPTRSNVQVQLPPAFNFAAFRQSSSPSTSSSSCSPPSSPRSHHIQSSSRQYSPRSAVPVLQRSTTDYSARQQTLYTSASRSSLSSISSSSTIGVSDQALSELQKYSNAFDHFRDYKRRVTLG